jgi:hypothetical protein
MPDGVIHPEIGVFEAGVMVQDVGCCLSGKSHRDLSNEPRWREAAPGTARGGIDSLVPPRHFRSPSWSDDATSAT